MSKKPKKSLKEINESFSTNQDEYFELVEKYFKALDTKKKLYQKLNPTDAPNDVLKHAIVDGIKLPADEVLAKGEYFPLLKIGEEQFYIWVYKEDTEAFLIVEVNPKVKDSKVWKTAVSILEIAFTMMHELEVSFDLEYNWIYRFNFNQSPENFHFLFNQDYFFKPSSIKRVPDFQKILPLIELLSSDNKFYVACQNIIQAKANHEFCQICALTPEHVQMHKHHEPELWEQTSWIPKMETAIVQATRTVESLIGKPGKKLDRTRQRWYKSLNLDPDSQFKIAEKSYIDFYYDLFQIRGVAAHSLGKLSFDISRSMTIQAQSFAWVILVNYYKKLSKSEQVCISELQLNLKLIDKFPKNISTMCTKK